MLITFKKKFVAKFVFFHSGCITQNRGWEKINDSKGKCFTFQNVNQGIYCPKTFHYLGYLLQGVLNNMR